MPKKTDKKTGVVMVIAVGGKAPKKPTKTADTEKAGRCGVVGVKKGEDPERDEECPDCGAAIRWHYRWDISNDRYKHTGCPLPHFTYNEL